MTLPVRRLLATVTLPVRRLLATAPVLAGALAAGATGSPVRLATLVPAISPLPAAVVVRNGAPSPADLDSLDPGGTAPSRSAFNAALRSAGADVWARTWRAAAAGETATAADVHTTGPGSAATMARLLAAAVRTGGTHGPTIPGVPGASTVLVDSPDISTRTPGSEAAVAVIAVGDDVGIVSVTAAGHRPGATAVVDAQLIALAQAQYRLLAAAVPLPTRGRAPVLAIVALGVATLCLPALEPLRRRRHGRSPRRQAHAGADQSASDAPPSTTRAAPFTKRA